MLVGSIASDIVLSGSKDDKRWYDALNYYITFPPEYTDIIDKILTESEEGDVTSSRVVSSSKKIPEVGTHYYNLKKLSNNSFKKVVQRCLSDQSIGLIKEKEKTNDAVLYYYRAYFTPTENGKKAFETFEELLYQTDDDVVRVISIDTSSMTPSLMFLNKTCREPRTHQIKAMNIIAEHWKKNGFNTKVMLCGKRGLGKTYTAMLLKNYIDSNFKGACTRLYDDFDPTSIGVNIKKMALTYASEGTPIILVINEADIMLGETVKEKQSFDPREQHSRNKQTLNNMLDALSSVKYVISIFTTEKSPQELYDIREYRSFIRPGRVDMFIRMTKHNSVTLDRTTLVKKEKIVKKVHIEVSPPTRRNNSKNSMKECLLTVLILLMTPVIMTCILMQKIINTLRKKTKKGKSLKLL